MGALNGRSPVRSALAVGLLGAAAISCSSSTPSAPPTDAGIDGPDDAIIVPPLDPSACAAPEPPGPAFDPAYIPVDSTRIEDKALYLLALLASDAPSIAAIDADSTLGPAGQARDAGLRDAAMTCKGDATCIAASLVPTASTVDAEAAALSAALESAGRLAWIAGSEMRASGRFARYASLSDADLVATAYRDAAAALAAGFDAYARAISPDALAAALTSIVDAHPEPLSFFQPLKLVVIEALAVDSRDEATRYEPLDEGENAPVFAAIPTVDFAAYPFSMILVPGKGPDVPDVILDVLGRDRCDLAAARFEKKLAPLIAVSGGHVHPDRTPYSEAIEMKKYLVNERGIPEDRVLIDPHARHTTTNLRNVSRLALRYGAPADQPILVTSDIFQSLYIGYWMDTFGPRCQDELGYLPWRVLVPISDNDSCFVPTSVSLHQDARDLLDP